ncbi:MAG TPA: hypothetical protein VK212_09965, partial [Lentimicrobium sp.]|nr:hypothetical protein [Lentimicrobium sp.]
SAAAGFAFFAMLFFAGITSSLAMGTPGMSFLMDEFNWSRKKSAWSFGIITLLLGLPTVIFFREGVFDEYDYWGGTISLVVFALLESILFAWIFGIKKGWREITSGADIKIPVVYKYIIKYITPVALIFVFFGAMFRPVNDDWSTLSFRGWPLHNESIIGQLQHKGIGPNDKWFADQFYAEDAGAVDSVYLEKNRWYIAVSKENSNGTTVQRTYEFKPEKHKVVVQPGQAVAFEEPLYTGKVVNRVFYIDMARGLLIAAFLFICSLVFIAYHKRKREGRGL